MGSLPTRPLASNQAGGGRRLGARTGTSAQVTHETWPSDHADDELPSALTLRCPLLGGQGRARSSRVASHSITALATLPNIGGAAKRVAELVEVRLVHEVAGTVNCHRFV